MAVAEVSTEVIVVDNASTDNPAEVIAALFPAARTTVNERNIGFAAACNIGAKAAVEDYLLFLNPDVVIDPDAIERLLEAAEAHDRAGLVSGRLRFPSGSFQATSRRFPTIGNMIFSRGSAPARLFFKGDTAAGRYTLPDAPETTPVPAVAATLALVRRELFERAGGFDERFFMFMEDTDLSLRLEQAGHVNLFVPAAGGVHRWGEGARVGRWRRLWHHHLSLWKYFLKHFPNGFSVLVLPVLLLVNLVLRALMPEPVKGAESL
jgi:GT2 family glycosyltransferase